MIKAVQVDLQLVLVQQLIVPSRRTAALHRPEVLAPARPSRVLFQSFLFRPPVNPTKTITYGFVGRPQLHTHRF